MKTFFTIKESLFGNNHPQEDFLLFSNKYPIFVAADGVTLNFDNEKKYPKVSGALEAAKVFCQAVVSEAEKRYGNFKKEDLKEIFEAGNNAVRQYNISKGRTQKTINYFDIDLFSATASFVLVKNGKAYWWSLCDSGVKLFNKKGKKLFASPDGWIHFPKNWSEGKNSKEKIIIRHRDYRNAVSKTGQLTGYGVADGEDSAGLYLNTGVLKVKSGDLIFVYTDGFENYFNLKGFIEIFRLWPEDLDSKLEVIISEKSKKDPKKYAAEKTLIAASY